MTTTSSLLRLPVVAGPRSSSIQAPNARGRSLPIQSFDRGSLRGGLAFMRHHPASSGSVKVSGSTCQRGRAPAPVTRCLAAANTVVESTSTSVSVGSPEPLGVCLNRDTGAINFAIFSEHATSVTLCILEDESSNTPTKTYVLDAGKGHKTGAVWHIAVKGLPTYCRYAYQVGGQGGWETGSRWDPKALLIDPYAKLVDGRRVFKTGGITPFFGVYDVDPQPFDWGADYKLPAIPEKDLVIYEMNVRGFTADASSELPEGVRGSFLGVVEKVDHLKELGVNAVELLPVYEFDELEFQRRENPRKHMVNTWGYSTVNFFAPMARYASNGGGPRAAAREFKQMVKALHAAGIEVILDVVYNHTAENDDQHPYMLSFRGVDNLVYYMVDTNSYVQLMNFSGCGNSFNCNHPAVMRLVLDSLRHWVTEYHVDGFRFDLASSLCRDTRGQPMVSPTVLRAIAHDDVLKRCKIIAEPWDCGGLYQVGSFPNWDRWAEWNGKYRDCVRRFVKGTGGQKKELATRLSGSADLYNTNQRKPYHSINFVIAHDGFTLRDLVSYNFKHNEANGEGGSDGANDNESWNHGVEGETEDGYIRGLRWRQMKNFLVVLMMSQGTPMVLMGDEYGHTRFGNNNSYGHDTELNWYLWNQLERKRNNYFHFYQGLVNLRRRHPLLGRDSFMTQEDVTWHESNWDDPGSCFLAFTLHDKNNSGAGSLYCALNAHNFVVDAALPAPPQGKSWHRLVDTNLPSPEDFSEDGVPGMGGRYGVAPYSSIILSAK